MTGRRGMEMTKHACGRVPWRENDKMQRRRPRRRRMDTYVRGGGAGTRPVLVLVLGEINRGPRTVEGSIDLGKGNHPAVATLSRQIAARHTYRKFALVATHPPCWTGGSSVLAGSSTLLLR